MGAVTGYVPQDYRRVCDMCGVLRNRSKLRKMDGLYICDYHKGERTRQELNRENIRLRKTYRIVSVPDGKPQDRVAPDMYSDDEARLFNFLVNQPVDYKHWQGEVVVQRGVSPVDFWDVTNGDGGPRTTSSGGQTLPTAALSIDAASETIRYLYDLLIDNRRPVDWMDDATRKLRELADFLLASQLGNPNGSSADIRNVAATASFYGSFDHIYAGSSAEYSGVAAGALYALLLAFRRLGGVKYLEGARQAATFLRRTQCGDLQTFNPASNGSARFHYGCFANRVLTNGAMHHTYYPEDNMLALEALTLLRTVDGDGTYGDAAAVGSFSYPTAATLTTMITECRAFWASGAFDSVTGTTYNGFASVTPRQYFQAGFLLTASQPFWFIELVGLVSPYHPWALRPRPWAKALRSLYAIEGYSSQVADVYRFLRSTTASANAQIPAGNSAASATSRQACWGTYDPNIALIGRANRTTATVNVTTAAGAAANAAQGPASAAAFDSLNCLYDPATVGYLARIQAAQEPTNFKAAKVAWHRERPRYTGANASPHDTYDPLFMDYAGFNSFNITPALDSLDPDAYGFGGKLCRLYYAEVAAINGVIYRLPPFVYPGSEARPAVEPLFTAPPHTVATAAAVVAPSFPALVNGTADDGAGSPAGAPTVIPGWTNTNTVLPGVYDQAYYDIPASAGPSGHGSNFFSGGTSAVSSLSQDLNLSPNASAIDAGSVAFVLSGYLGGWQNNDDSVSVTVGWKDGGGGVLGSNTIGPVVAADRGGVSALLFRSTAGTVPVGTRTATVVATFTRSGPGYNDAAADNIQLVFT